MIVARIAIDYETYMGEWRFTTLPREGEMIAIGGEHGPLVVEVTGVIHIPVATDVQGIEDAPTVTLNTTLHPRN